MEVKKATAEEFAAAYASRSGVTVQWLRQHGREVRPCDCGADACEGWQMARVKMETSLGKRAQMTDCYICGHPILEGQLPGTLHPPRAEHAGDVVPEMPSELQIHNDWLPVHLNPADHLPTLMTRYNERKRAAEMVKIWSREKLSRTKLMPPWFDADEGMVSDLVAQIKGDE